MTVQRLLQAMIFCLLLVGVAGQVHSAQAAPQANTLYVDVNTGNDSGNNCRTASAPCKSIQRAINQSTTGDAILVQAGTYTYPGTDNPCDQFLNGLKAVVCIINKQLTIRGGYANGDWSTPNPAANVTIIDGEKRVRGAYVLSSDPSKASIAGVTLEGVTVRNGYVRGATSGGDNNTFAFGGGMLTDYASVTLRDVRFENNAAYGGGTQNDYGGSASGGGAAIRRTPGRSVMERVVFESNLAESGAGRTRSGYSVGGGLYLLMAEVDGTGLQFYNNIARSGNTSGSGKTSDGQTGDAFGAAAAIMGYADVSFFGAIAKNNQTIGGNATAQGAGAFGGAFKVEGVPNIDSNGDGIKETALARFYDCDISNNTAQGGNGQSGGLAAGGGIETIHASLIVDRCRIQDNVAQGGNGSSTQGPAGGGGLYLQNIFHGEPKATVKNSIVAFNRVAAGTGAAVGGGGGGLWLQGIETTLSHNTILGNRMLTSPLQGASVIVLNDGVQSGAKPLSLQYNIIANHPDSGLAALHVKTSNTANLSYNLMHGNASNVNTQGVGTINGMSTSVLSNPLFQTTPTETGSRVYKLSSASPAINRANGSTETVDIEYQPRTGVPDIGAYEASQLTLNVTVIPVSSQSLYVRWGQTSGASQYRVTLTCPSGTLVVACNGPAYYGGDAADTTLTGLTNYASYAVEVAAMDAAGGVLTSASSTGVPTDIFVFLPIMVR